MMSQISRLLCADGTRIAPIQRPELPSSFDEQDGFRESHVCYCATSGLVCS